MASSTLFFAFLLLAYQSLAQTVQEDWTFPKSPDKTSTLELGQTYNLTWTVELNSWFSDYCPACNSKDVDLWTTGGPNDTYHHKIAASIDVTATLSYAWNCSIPTDVLASERYWVLRFVPHDATPGPGTPQISSPVFYVDNNVPAASAPASAPTTTSAASMSITPTPIFINNVAAYSSLYSCAERQLSTIVRDMSSGCGDDSHTTSFNCFCSQSSSAFNSIISTAVSSQCKDAGAAQATSALAVFSSYCALAPTTAQTITSPSTTSATTLYGVPVSTASTTATPSAQVQPTGVGLSTGAKAGIGIGAAIGAIALFAIGFFVARRSIKSKAQTPADKIFGEDSPPVEVESMAYVPKGSSAGKAPMGSQQAQWQQPSELNGENREAAELGTHK